MQDYNSDLCEVDCTHPHTICLARAGMLPEETIRNLAETFKVLGDPTRIRILHILAKQEMCVCDIAETIKMTQSAISHQLRVLRGFRLVKYRKEGKEAWYSLDDHHVLALMCQALDHVNHTGGGK